MTIREDKSPCNLLIFQPALPLYRRSFFGQLAQRVTSVTLVHGGQPLPGEVGTAMGGVEGVRTIAVPQRTIGPALWMPALWRMANGREDVAVFSWNSRYVHLPVAMRRARRAGMGVALWGHGYSTRGETPTRLWYRNQLARWADVVLTYNRRAANELVADGLAGECVFVAPNALDGGKIEMAIGAWTRSPNDLLRFRDSLRLGGGPLVLHVSRLSNMANLRVLIETWRLIVSAVPEARLFIIGDGPARAEFLTAIEACGVSGSIRCLGAIYDEETIAPYFLNARLMLHPNKIGLSLNHAMHYGVPVATFDDPMRHSPEFEALRDGVNGVTAPPDNVPELARCAAHVLRDDRLASRLGENAAETMRGTYTLDAMVDGFLAAAERARAAAMLRSPRVSGRALATASQQQSPMPLLRRFRIPRPRRHWTPQYTKDRIQLRVWEYRHPDAPWLVAEVVHLLETWLQKHHVVVEFGSGRSTTWLAQRVGVAISIEHDPRWYARVRERLQSARLENVRYHCVPVDDLSGEECTAAYLRPASEHLEGYADVILVDGILRDACANWALEHVRPGGMIIVDNVNRYLPHATRSPASLGPKASPASPGWHRFAAAVKDWRYAWFSNGVTDTAVFFRQPDHRCATREGVAHRPQED